MTDLAIRKSGRFLPRPQSGPSTAALRISSILRERVQIETHSFIKGGFLEEISQLEARVSMSSCNRHLRTYFANFNKEKDLTVLALRTGDGLIGYSVGRRSSAADSFMIDLLGIAPSYQFRGIAKHLLAHCFELIRSKGYKTVCLTCKQKSVNGIDLPKYYASLGFKPTAVKELLEMPL
jgi:GNAT superfamily N-acetyltransferase